MINKKFQTSHGFTIVELIVVIVVIGILAAISLVSYNGITSKAINASLQSDLTNTSTKLKIYSIKYGNYPLTMVSGDGNVTYCPTGPVDDDYCIKPSSGTSLSYRVTSQGFMLVATKGALAYSATEARGPVAGDPNWITIGTQKWATVNINVGTMINGVTEQTNNSTLEKYCYEDLESNCTADGALYQWGEAMQYVTSEGAQGVCPAGSHIPSDNDIKKLEVQLGMTQAQADLSGVNRGTDQGTKMKPSGISGLNIPLAGVRVIGG